MSTQYETIDSVDPQIRVRRDFHYDPVSGILKRVRSNNGISGGTGTPNSDGYLTFKWEGKCHKATHLIWLYYYGDWPTTDVDHQNRIKNDNRIDNLRLLTRSQNTKNSERSDNSKKGIYRAQTIKEGYVARYRPEGRREVHLGTFSTKELAAQAIQQYEQSLCLLNTKQ